MNWLYLGIYDPNGSIFDEVADLGFGKALLVSLVAIALVFLVLLIIISAVKIMQFVYYKVGKKVQPKQVEAAPVAQAAPKSVEIVDEDMMVAALIATIDYKEETKKDVKLKSIKRIG